MTTPVEYVQALLAAGSYRGVRSLLPVLDIPAQQRRAAQQLCDFALSIIDLDAEDWSGLGDVPAELERAARAGHVPQQPTAKDRGALESLEPTFAIMLEVVAVRYRQRDLAGVLMVCHIMSEYLPLLAWEPHLGHAGDPPRLADHVTREGSLWAIDRDHPRSRECAHSLSIRSSLREVIRVGRPAKEWSQEEYQRFWREYLDRDHSRVATGLHTCGLTEGDGRPRSLRACATKCAVWEALPGDKADLADRLAIAGQFVESPLIALRHAAPVGHGFGVPSAKEIDRAWDKTWRELSTKWSGRQNPLEARARKTGADAGEPLPGLSAMVSAIAGRQIAPSTLFREVDALLLAALS